MILLDTHVLIWLAEGNQRLGVDSRRLANRALGRDETTVASISFWEIGLLVGKARLTLDRSPAAFRLLVLGQGVRELRLTGEMAITAAELVGFHPDPADRLIVASALSSEATLVTADARILRWSGPLKTHDARR